MLREVLSEPRARKAYVVTKVGVFAAAALATTPLAHVFGSRAWVGLAVFALVLAAMTVGVLLAARPGGPRDDAMGGTGEEADDEPDPAGTTVLLPVEDSFDLHPFQPRDVPAVVHSYLETAVEAGLREVRVIHGRGIGVQRDRVRRILSRHPAVLSFRDAPADRGGWGATIAELRADALPPRE